MKNIVSCSFGKDSLAQIIVMKKLEFAIDEIIYYNVRFNDKISGEHPMLAEWIPTAEKILKSKYGLSVTHITASKTFTDYFYTVKKKGNHKGEIYGFPYVLGAWCNTRLKVDVINKYLNGIKDEVTQFIGLAYDEPDRYERLMKSDTVKRHKRSVLFEQEITENEAFEICKRENLLSPHYSLGGFRGGCWFCTKQSYADIYNLWLMYPDYFSTLLDMERESHTTFFPHSSLYEMDNRFKDGYIPKRRHKNMKT